jgi:hypothetical protein
VAELYNDTSTSLLVRRSSGQAFFVPSSGAQSPESSQQALNDRTFAAAIRQAPTPSPAPSVTPTKPLSDRAELFYLSRYSSIVGAWFDLFDTRDTCFATVVPHKALNNELLLRACLSSSAKQYHLITAMHARDSIMLYDSALQSLQLHLNEELHTREDTTLAANLLIAWVEMVDNNTQEWGAHLQGAHHLVTIGKWHEAREGLGFAVSGLMQDNIHKHC